VKVRRQLKILEIIRNSVVETQEELANQLRQQAIEVTQATVSRDIKELHLVKVPNHDGRYRYALPDGQFSGKQVERMRRIFRECLVNLDAAGNLVVIKTLSGTAGAVGEAVDSLQWPEIVGSIAGDNTVVLIIREETSIQDVLGKLRHLM